MEACPYLFVNHGSTNASLDVSLTASVGSVLAVTCDDGYDLQGLPVALCRENGTWSHTPLCKNMASDSMGGQSTVILVTCAVASVVALGVLAFAVYMLCCNVKSEKEAKQQQKEQKEIEDMQNLRIYQSVNQDNVGMPAVVYGNFNRTLRGRPAGSEECPSDAPAASPRPVTSSTINITDSSTFIY